MRPARFPRKTKVLIIDDEENLCFFIKANLEMENRYQVLVATNGKKGLSMAGWDKPNIILLDIMMPGMDGFEVLKRLKESEKTASIPVIMLTALQDEDSKMKAASLYGEDYIVKPIAIEDLKARIDSTLSGRPPIS